jgi:predicted  nucleic acid-binding Zn-ribbon protein
MTKQKHRFPANGKGLADAMKAVSEACRLGKSVNGHKLTNATTVRGKRLIARFDELAKSNEATGALPSEDTCRSFICEAVAIEKEILGSIKDFVSAKLNIETERLVTLMSSAPSKYSELGGTLSSMLNRTQELLSNSSSTTADIASAYESARIAIDTAMTEAAPEIEETRRANAEVERMAQARREKEENKKTFRKQFGAIATELQSAFA